MTTALSGTVFSLADLAKRMDPDGSPARIIELLTKQNNVLQDVMWMEANNKTGHVTTQRTGLPDVYYRLINQGVANSKSTTAQITEGTSILEARSQLDVKLAEFSKNPAALRLSESQPFLEAMKQKTVTTLFYGNSSVNPEQFNGLAIRYSSLGAGNGENIIDAGGANSVNTSIWLVVWGENTLAGIYPEGTSAGLKHEDLGIQDAFDSSDRRFRAYMDRYEWCAGIALKDWQYVVRIANIDKTKLVTESSAADLIKSMLKAYARIPDVNAGKAAFYMNRTVFQMLAIQRAAAVSTGGGVTWDNVDGKFVPSFMGIPIRIVDGLLLNETRVV